MKIVVFGASGGTGKELVKQGVAAGHEVTAFVRERSRFSPQPRLTVQVGDVYKREDVEAAVRGEDAVFSALGARAISKSDLLQASMANILAGMREAGVRRLIVLGAASTMGPEAMRDQPILRKMMWAAIKSTLLRWPFRSQEAMHRLIMQSDLDWTIVEPPRLINGPHTGQYRVAADALPSNSARIDRADVADFMLKQLATDEWVRKTPHIAN